MNVPIWAWLAVLGVILAMLAVDLLAHRRAHVVGVREAAAWSIVWVSLAVIATCLVVSVTASLRATRSRELEEVSS